MIRIVTILYINFINNLFHSNTLRPEMFCSLLFLWIFSITIMALMQSHKVIPIFLHKTYTSIV
jgi:hypothetical protein